MDKRLIKELLRENLLIEDDNESKKKKVKYEKDYSEVQRKLDGTMLKQSQVMAAAGLGNKDDATDRSLFNKKVRKEKNEHGDPYLFNDDELASVLKVISNPVPYLNVKK
jgi:hypothetical protein